MCVTLLQSSPCDQVMMVMMMMIMMMMMMMLQSIPPVTR